jgi:predicted nucleic acid-binding protein
MQSFTVVLDACVLVPVTAADTLLRLAERDMYRPVWSERILEEAKRAIATLHSDLPAEQIEYRFDCMNKAFEDASVSGWEGLERSIILPDENDRHVLACALVAGADAIVTNNVRDFPDEALAPFSIEVIRLDDFLLDLFDLAPEEFAAVVHEQVNDAKHPPLSTADLLGNLAAAGAPETAAELRPFLE